MGKNVNVILKKEDFYYYFLFSVYSVKHTVKLSYLMLNIL